MTESSGVAVDTKAGLFLQALKRSTAGQHELLESNSLLSAIVHPSVTVRQYYTYLLLMQKVAEGYEQNVLPKLAGIFPGCEQNEVSALIADDLQSIAYELPLHAEIATFTLPKEMTVAFCLGFMYVMEGSKLGGKVIFKHIQRTLGFSEERGAKFIADHGKNTGRLWREFLVDFGGYVTENSAEEEAIQGARYAFTSIYDFFESNRLIYED